MTRMKFEIPSIAEIYDYLTHMAYEIRNKNINIDVIVGIARGGLIPARFLSDLLLIPKIEIISAGFYTSVGKRMDKPIIYTNIGDEYRGKNVLLVDDVADTGETLEAVRRKLLEKGAVKVYTAVIYIKPWNKAKIDFYARKTDAWIIFPWEFIETVHQLLKMDGVEHFKNIVKRDDKLRDIINKFVGDIV